MGIKNIRSLEDWNGLEEGDFVRDTKGQLMVAGSWDNGTRLYTELEKDGIIGAYNWVDIRMDGRGIILLQDSAIRLDKNSQEYRWAKHLLSKRSLLATE